MAIYILTLMTVFGVISA